MNFVFQRVKVYLSIFTNCDHKRVNVLKLSKFDLLDLICVMIKICVYNMLNTDLVAQQFSNFKYSYYVIITNKYNVIFHLVGFYHGHFLFIIKWFKLYLKWFLVNRFALKLNATVNVYSNYTFMMIQS